MYTTYLINLGTSSGLRTDNLCLNPNSEQLFSAIFSPGCKRAAEEMRRYSKREEYKNQGRAEE